MKKLLPICLLALLAACSTTTVERVETDGTKFRATNRRALWKSQGIEITYGRTNTNVAASAKIDTTGSDAEAVKAAVEGAVTAAVKATTGK